MTDHPLQDEELREKVEHIVDKTLHGYSELTSDEFENFTEAVVLLVLSDREQTLAEVREQIKEALPEKNDTSMAVRVGSAIWLAQMDSFNECIDTLTTNLKAKGLL